MLRPNSVHAGHLVLNSGSSGAQGIVHLAKRIHDNELVAMKVIDLPPKEHDSYWRFKYENVILHRLKPHENIVSPFSNVSNDGTHANYTMEFLEHDLQSYETKLNGPDVSIESKVALAIGICKGLQHAHSKGIFHRDLHPGNVRIKEPDTVLPISKLADFGLSKILKHSLESPDPFRVWGYGVRPPEITLGIKDNPQHTDYELADIFSLGVTMRWIFSSSDIAYVILVRSNLQQHLINKKVLISPDDANFRRKYSEADRARMFEEWLLQFPPVWQDFLKIELIEVDIAKKLTAIISKACNPDPSKRFCSVGAIITELESI